MVLFPFVDLPVTDLKEASSAKSFAKLHRFFKKSRLNKLQKLCQHRSGPKLAAVRVAKLQRAITQAHLKVVKHQSNRCTAVRRCKKNAEKAMRLVAPVLRKLGARRITGFPNAACQTCQCFANTKQIIFGNKQHTFPLKDCIQKATDATVDKIQV